MNKTLVITAITLVAVVMGMSSVVPAIANHGGTGDCIPVELRFGDAKVIHRDASAAESDIDRNGNGNVCGVNIPANENAPAFRFAFDDHIVPAMRR